MRRLKLSALVLALALLCSLGLVACKNDDNPPDTDPTLYTVTFVTNGGSAVPDQGVYEGQKATKPGDPTRGGYAFENWYKEEALTNLWNFDTDTVTEDTTLYAKWKLQAASQDANFEYAPVGDTYLISKKLGAALPADLVLPSEHEGKAVTAIADNAFENEAGLKSIVIPDSITAIGKQAFRNCAALETINEAKNIEEIGSNAFYGTAWDLALTGEDIYLGKTYYKYAGGMYTDTEITVKDGTVGVAAGAFDSKEKLTKVTLPETLKYIGDYAFGGAQKGTGLTSVTLPAGLTKIGNNAFRNAKLAAVKIGASVEYIGDSAFAGCPAAAVEYAAANAAFGALAPFNNNTTAASLTIDENVTAYPAGLFTNWTGLSKVDFGGVAEIPANAFDGKSALKAAAFDKAVKIGNYAFRGTAITEVTLPETLTDIGNGAFANCAKLAKITMNAESLTAAPGASALAFANCTAVKEIAIGQKAEIIPDELFRGLSGVTTLNLGAAKTIGDHAFYGIAVTTLTVPAGVTSLGQDAFGGNAALTTLTFQAVEAVTNAGATSLFAGCSSLQTVTVAAGVKNVPAYFLTGNTLVEMVALPDSVASVGDHAFDGCTALSDISGVEQITSIGQNAFNDTPWFTEYMKTPGIVYLGSVLYAFNGDMPANYALTVRAGTTAISPEAFKNKTNMVSVTFPATLTEIGSNAFLNCTGLTEVSLPEKVTTLGEGAFNGCSSLKTLTLSDNLTQIPEMAFNGCIALTAVNIPASVTAIGANAFDGCHALSEILIPGTVKTIGNAAFNGCNGAATVTIGNGVESIGTSAFRMTKASAVTVPASVKTLGTEIFSGCNELTTATIQCAAVGERMFFDCIRLANVTLGDDVKSIGAEAFFGSTDANMLKQLKSINLNKVETIGTKAFCSTGLTSLTLPGTVTEIGANAFDSCSSLNIALVIPASVTKLGTECFKKSGITSVTIPGSLKTFPNAFRECGQLTSVTIGEGVETIGAAAFMMCRKLNSVTLPASVKKIEGYAFQDVKIVYLHASTTAEVDSMAFDKAVFLTDKAAEYRASNGWKAYADRIFAENALVDEVFIVENGVLSMYLGESGTIAIPKDAASIQTGAFDGTTVTAFTLAEGNTSFSIADGNLLNAAGTEFILYASGKTADTYTIPENVTSIAAGAFAANKSLQSVTLLSTTPPTMGANAFPSTVRSFHVPKDCGDAYRSAWTALADYITAEGEGIKEFVVADGVLTQYNGSDVEVVIPDEVTKISKDAFAGKTAITKMTIGKNVVTIDRGAFVDLVNLTHVVYNAVAADDCTASGAALVNIYFYYMTTLEIGPDVTKIPAFMFEDCYELTGAVIPANVKSIGENAFKMDASGKSKFVALTLNEGLESIGSSAFANCAIAGTVTIPSTVTSIDNLSFDGNTGITAVRFNAINATTGTNTPFNGCTNLTDVVFGDKVEYIGDHLFYNVASLNCELKLPAGLKEIGGSAFSGTKVTGDIVIPTAITEIPQWVFTGTMISSVTLHDGITSIGNSAFNNCVNLTGTLTLSSGLLSLGNSAFSGTSYSILEYNCAKVSVKGSIGVSFLPSNLTTIQFGSNVTEIPAYMFARISFETLVLPEGITTLGQRAFWQNYALKKVTLPSTLTTFGTQVFNNCTAIEEFVFAGEVPPTIPAAGLGTGFNENFVIKVPAASVDAYKTATNWTQYVDKIVADTETPEPEPTPEPAPAALPAQGKKDEPAA